MELKCPYCGHDTVNYRYSTSTLMGWTPILKNGILQNNDPNYHTSYYTCCQCGHNFHTTEQYGKVKEIVDDGPTRQVPTIEMPIAVNSNSCLTIGTNTNDTITAGTLTASNTLANKDDIEELKTDIDILEGRIECISARIDQVESFIRKLKEVLQNVYI